MASRTTLASAAETPAFPHSAWTRFQSPLPSLRRQATPPSHGRVRMSPCPPGPAPHTTPAPRSPPTTPPAGSRTTLSTLPLSFHSLLSPSSILCASAHFAFVIPRRPSRRALPQENARFVSN